MIDKGNRKCLRGREEERFGVDPKLTWILLNHEEPNV